MYFVTDEPVLFNTNTGVVIRQNANKVWLTGIVPDEHAQAVFSGTRQECEDFIYSIAGWVGAVNPVTLEKAVNDEL